MSVRWKIRGITAAAMLAVGAAGSLAMAQAPGTAPGAGVGPGAATGAPATSPEDQTNPRTEPQRGTTPTERTAESGNTSAGLSKADQKFIRKAAEGGLAEVQLGQLAQQQGSSDAVKEFGQRMVTDHQTANQKLQSIAQEQNIELPTTLSKHDQKKLEKLQSLHGAAFDKAYAREMRTDHRKDIHEFEHEAKHGKDTQLKEFADSTLPTLKEHLSMAEKLNSSSREASAAGTETSPTTR